MAKTVVVLGAGTGGLAAAERLRADLPADDRVVLIDRCFTGSMGLSALRVLRGWRTAAEVATTVRADALPGVSMVTGEVVGVDTGGKMVRYCAPDADGKVGYVEYDALVVALGAAMDTSLVPGLDAAIAAGVAGEFYTPAGAAELHRRVEALQSGRVVVLIPSLPFRCPPAPYEAAFLIADQLGERFTGGAVRIDVITCEPRPVAVADAEVGTTVVDLLAGPGIGFHPEKAGAAIDPDACTVAFADGSSEPFDLLAVVPPHVSPAAALLPGAVNAGGWLPVDPVTLATGVPGVWAVGDVTALPLAHGLPAPKAGFMAENAGVAVADQVARHLGYDGADTRLNGEGGCIVEVGAGQAAKVAGDFLAAPTPAVSLYPPSAAFHDEKAQLERDWLARWN